MKNNKQNNKAVTPLIAFMLVIVILFLFLGGLINTSKSLAEEDEYKHFNNEFIPQIINLEPKIVDSYNYNRTQIYNLNGEFQYNTLSRSVPVVNTVTKIDSQINTINNNKEIRFKYTDPDTGAEFIEHDTDSLKINIDYSYIEREVVKEHTYAYRNNSKVLIHKSNLVNDDIITLRNISYNINNIDNNIMLDITSKVKTQQITTEDQPKLRIESEVPINRFEDIKNNEDNVVDITRNNDFIVFELQDGTYTIKTETVKITDR